LNNINDIFEKLFNYFNVNSIKELSEKIGLQPSTISNWKQRSSISAIKKKCRELNIYNDIFSETNLMTEDKLSNEKIQEMYDAILDDSKYRLKEKLQNYTDASFIDWMNKMIPKKILINTLKELSKNKNEYNLNNSKQTLLVSLRTLEVSFINEKNKHQISDYIKDKLSNIECYILIQEHEEIMNYKGFWK
jgi:transcriptional regulator with XRE-family HTH domain